MIASMNGNYTIANYLVASGANMALESKDGKI